MTEAQQREAVVAEALTWLRCPYHQNARIKGVGVDCAQFPVAVYSACGLIPNLDPKYANQWHLNRREELYLDEVRKWAREVETFEEAGPGGFGLWQYGRTYSHGGILLPDGQVIHAVMDVGMVTIDSLTDAGGLVDRPAKFFTLWGGAADGG